MMNRLAIETATSVCSIALETPKGVWTRCESDQRIHSKVLLPWIGGLLSDAGLGYQDLDALVVGTGPGGFTSLRVGLAVVQGISVAHHLPIYPVSTLVNIAAGCDSDRPVLVVMDARLGQVYTQAFEVDHRTQRWTAINEATVVPPDQLALPDRHADGRTDGHANWTVVGDGLEAHHSKVPGDVRSQAAAWLPAGGPTAERALTLTERAVEPWGLRAHYVRNNVTH